MSQGTESHLEHAEHTRHAAHDPFDRRVAMTMAIIAAALALVTMLSHRTHTETLRLQAVANVHHTQASDKWTYYQSKKNREYMYQATAEELPLLAKDPKNPETATQAAALAGRWKQTAKKYESDTEKLQEEARELEAQAAEAESESHHAHARADRFDLGELGVELALVLCSIAVLTKNVGFWYSAMVIGVIGFGLGMSAFLVH